MKKNAIYVYNNLQVKKQLRQNVYRLIIIFVKYVFQLKLKNVLPVDNYCEQMYL